MNVELGIGNYELGKFDYEFVGFSSDCFAEFRCAYGFLMDRLLRLFGLSFCFLVFNR
jgi:hypothetical protein